MDLGVIGIKARRYTLSQIQNWSLNNRCSLVLYQDTPGEVGGLPFYKGCIKCIKTLADWVVERQSDRE